MSEFDCEEHQEDRDEIWSCLSCVAESYYAEERDRIIKLLEDNWVEPMDWLSVKELIKGEQK